MVAREFGNHRADLLIAGRQQEGRRATIGFRADYDEAAFRLREFGDAVRRDGAAGMQIGIDQRRELRRRLHRRIQVDAQLAQERQIGPEAGGHDDAIHIEGQSALRRALRRR